MITAALPTQEQVDRIAEELKPDVVRIRFQIGRDWSDDPSIKFRVVLSDEASRPERLPESTAKVRDHLAASLRLEDLDHIAYFRFRSRSEQEALGGEQWS